MDSVEGGAGNRRQRVLGEVEGSEVAEACVEGVWHQTGDVALRDAHLLHHRHKVESVPGARRQLLDVLIFYRQLLYVEVQFVGDVRDLLEGRVGSLRTGDV